MCQFKIGQIKYLQLHCQINMKITYLSKKIFGLTYSQLHGQDQIIGKKKHQKYEECTWKWNI